jgi:hypothetical protein
MTGFEALRQQLRQDVRALRPARRRWVLPLAAVLAAMGLSAVALAASGVLTQGSDVGYDRGRAPQPTTGNGVAVAGSVGELVTAPDPHGGLAWGVRTYRTTRGFACVQVGRAQGGELGIIGQDGAFANDRRFHPLRPGAGERCVPLDPANHALVAYHNGFEPASASEQGCAVIRFPQMLRSRAKRCPTKDLRRLDYGLLGPAAASYTYRDAHGTSRTVKSTSPAGAFLVVRASTSVPSSTSFFAIKGKRTPAAIRHAVHQTNARSRGFYNISRTPISPNLVRVTYTDGGSCRVRYSDSNRGGCPARGLVTTTVALPSHAALATAIHATLDHAHHRVHVTFRARVAATKQRAGYAVLVYPRRHGGPCGPIGGTVDRDVPPGDIVHAGLPTPGCAGPYRVVVRYRVQRAATGILGSGLEAPGRLVGNVQAH